MAITIFFFFGLLQRVFDRPSFRVRRRRNVLALYDKQFASRRETSLRRESHIR